VNCCGNPNIPAAPETLAGFATRSNCAEEPDERRPKPTIVHRVWQGCEDGVAVELYTIEGGGHTWPGASFDLASRGLGVTTKDLIATETIWAFFEAHPLPPT
jgi:polyhydroxybutyrate depolymerase